MLSDALDGFGAILVRQRGLFCSLCRPFVLVAKPGSVGEQTFLCFRVRPEAAYSPAHSCRRGGSMM